MVREDVKWKYRGRAGEQGSEQMQQRGLVAVEDLVVERVVQPLLLTGNHKWRNAVKVDDRFLQKHLKNNAVQHLGQKKQRGDEKTRALRRRWRHHSTRPPGKYFHDI